MLALIPARGGSKGVPRKNIKELCGRPLIYYTIECAKKSKYIDRIIVSTEDEEIAQIALDNGAEVPFLRPKELATDTSMAIDTYTYTMDKLAIIEKQKREDLIILQPTSPFRQTLDVDNAIELFRQKEADSVISVCEAVHPPQWYKKIDNNGVLRNAFDMEVNLNRQQYDKYFVPNGAIFVFNNEMIQKKRTYYTDKTFPVIMTMQNSLDIDTPLDFYLAQLIMQDRNK